MPPHVPLGVLRRVSGLKLEEVAELIAEVTGDRPTRGALSAIENGHRGASAQLIAGLEHAYNLPAGSISTTYVPRVTPSKSEVA
ncbi:hypothetical protein ABG82_19435 [Mycobacteroides immunogenum]|uniref:HTH cro/C1-type domain-containing protein n=1 Tax=Mycobacteroides immunogenum TaxID=83262 RepID=A0A7V8LKR0_9MYCO|nr:hypothetical protein ABG82_19435 [Mycobacteroides immunogenum]KIU37995.1 hypothetical protein TL11_24840 [Mycobacteroides immunogenum]KPG04215.1 hypothetical protein AN909_23330 [Mycobacteroides immunogenum]KPG04868.1 hypothetical protein AN908_23880 [Mycobacteroides immunogenum]KPG05599.1 hypothetical protein AN910_23070 [Mycobacteroides immunogenum]